MKILFLNTGYCTGITGKKHEYALKCWRYVYSGQKAFGELVRLTKDVNPDVLALAEIDSGSFRNGFKNHVHLLRDELGFKSVIHRSKYKHRGMLTRAPIFKNQCNAIFTRTSDAQFELDQFSQGTKRLIIKAEISPEITLVSVHLSLRKQIRARQLKELSGMLHDIKKQVILTGDFNTLGGAKELQTLLKNHQLVSANTDGAKTFPSWKPRKELDFFLVTPEINVKQFDVLESKLSDHLPIFLEI